MVLRKFGRILKEIFQRKIIANNFKYPRIERLYSGFIILNTRFNQGR